MKLITDEYIVIWIEQAERTQKHNPGDHASVDLDSWLAILRELRTARRRRRSTP